MEKLLDHLKMRRLETSIDNEFLSDEIRRWEKTGLKDDLLALCFQSFLFGHEIIKPSYYVDEEGYFRLEKVRSVAEKCSFDDEGEILDRNSKIKLSDESLIVLKNHLPSNPNGFNVAKCCAAYVSLKKAILEFRSIYAETRAIPKIIAKYPSSTQRSEAIETLNVLNEAILDSAIGIPDHFEVDFLSATSDADQIYDNALNYLDKQISIAMLGADLLLSAGKIGSHALGEVHSDAFARRIERIAQTFRNSSKIIAQNLADKNLIDLPEDFEIDLIDINEDKNLQTLQEIKLMRECGIIPSKSYLSKRLNLSERNFEIENQMRIENLQELQRNFLSDVQ